MALTGNLLSLVAPLAAADTQICPDYPIMNWGNVNREQMCITAVLGEKKTTLQPNASYSLLLMNVLSGSRDPLGLKDLLKLHCMISELLYTGASE